MATVFKRGGKDNRHGYWYVQWWELDGGRQRRRTKCTGTTDKAAAERIARKFEAEAALRREGVIDPTLDAISKESRRSIESHLADYESKLRAGGCSEQYIMETKRYIREIAKAGGFAVAAEVSADAVNRYANGLQEANKSARTVQAYLTAIKGFTKWLVANHKLPRDPLASIRKPNPKSDRRRERRMLLPDEWSNLAAATAAGPDRFGMSGQERVLLYRIAIESGLRSGELRALTRTSLMLDGAQPFIRAKAASTKNRKDAQQFIRRESADQLRVHVQSKLPTARVFDLPDPSDMATMLRDDLASARSAWLDQVRREAELFVQREQSDFLAERNHDGKVLDFHSLRHTCGAWLALSGVHPKVVQQVMRHSSITLTMDTYGHLFPGQEAEAVGRLGNIMGQQPPASLAATGTEDLTPKARSTGRSSCGTAQHVADTSPYDENAAPATLPFDENSWVSTASRNPVRSVTMPYINTAPLAQLAEQLTLNQ